MYTGEHISLELERGRRYPLRDESRSVISLSRARKEKGAKGASRGSIEVAE